MNNEVIRYNIRVYGILINETNELLLSKEVIKGVEVLKFPGGGHEFGEGVIDCLKREFKEELDVEILEVMHFYTTEFFQQSAFDNRDQLISIYYSVKIKDASEIMNGQAAIDEKENAFLWKRLDHLKIDDLNFPIDQKVVEMLKAR